MTLKLLLDKITPYLSDHERSTTKNLLIIVLSMLMKRTVCLNKLKSAVGGITGKTQVQVHSHYTRLIRFFKDNSQTDLWIDVVKCGLQLLRLDSKYLALDGTSWKRGSVWRHYMTLCVIYQGVAIPILWIDLAKRGSSSTEERSSLFDLAFKYYSLSGKILLADREYIGADWFKYLIGKGIDFVIRSRDYSYFSIIDENSQGKSVEKMIEKIKHSKKNNKALRKSFRLEKDGAIFWIVVAKNPCPEAKEDFMILITSIDQSVYRTVADYLKRWKIEHCFRQFKSNGFDLEVINLGNLNRRRLLMAVTVLAYIVAVTEGLKDYKRLVPLKRHGTAGKIYRAVSVFRFGVDQLASKLQRLVTFVRYLSRELHAITTGYFSSNLINV